MADKHSAAEGSKDGLLSQPPGITTEPIRTQKYAIFDERTSTHLKHGLAIYVEGSNNLYIPGLGAVIEA